MPARRLREGSGYSLVEVLVSITILTIAILPMMSMFDMGLQGATENSNYDQARTLANQKMEQAKNLPFVDVENNFPQAGITTPYDGEALDTWFTEPGADFANFRYTVEKDYIKKPDENPADPTTVQFRECTLLNECEPPTNLIRVAVTVQWSNRGNTNTYTTFGLVAR